MPAIHSRQTLRQRRERTRPPQIQRSMSIKEFYEKRNKVLIVRGVGGLGDILMHRMMFEDFKNLAPDMEIHFACPKAYYDAVVDHPHVDKVFHTEEYNRQDYIASYTTTTACGRYEMKQAPYSGLHRSDIWAAHCGVKLKNHNMHIHLAEEEKIEGRRLIEQHRDRYGPSVAVAPISAMHNKNLSDYQLLGLIQGLRERNLYPFGLHTAPIFSLLQNDIPIISQINIRQWLGVVDQADYVVSVDSATFHAAGGMGKPLVGIFSFADGKVYGRYFDFHLVQKHRDDPDWDCGPCYNWGACTKTDKNPKPCLTEITVGMILSKVDMMLENGPS